MSDRKQPQQASDSTTTLDAVAWGVRTPGLRPMVLFQGESAEEDARHFANLKEGRQARPLVFGDTKSPTPESDKPQDPANAEDVPTVDGWSLKLEDGEVWAEKDDVSTWIAKQEGKARPRPR